MHAVVSHRLQDSPVFVLSNNHCGAAAVAVADEACRIPCALTMQEPRGSLARQPKGPGERVHPVLVLMQARSC